MEFERVRCVIGRGATITNHDAGADEWRSRKITIQRFFDLTPREADRGGPIIPQESQVRRISVN
jgi:hypothetical protein